MGTSSTPTVRICLPRMLKSTAKHTGCIEVVVSRERNPSHSQFPWARSRDRGEPGASPKPNGRASQPVT
jgi:hypothetical protein